MSFADLAMASTRDRDGHVVVQCSAVPNGTSCMVVTVYPSAMPNDAAIGIVLQQQSIVDFIWWHWPTDEFAAWGQWAGGIGALLAVGLALGAMRRDRKKHQAELAAAARADTAARLKVLEDEAERHAARARAVVAGPGYESMGEPGFTKEMPIVTCGVKIANYSPSPVLEVVLEDVDMLAPDGGLHPVWLAQPISTMQLPRQIAAVVAPGGEEIVDLAVVGNVWPHVRSGQGLLKVTFTFLDIEGYRWRRCGSEAPVRINEDGTPWAAQKAGDSNPA
ncbi:hypothetical protein SK803_43170 [Lentzea sp. BCCO 10_0856]|uniref:Uncharacterized protein n=1 Tax=Lentzea miocenica TaxID=3095431 RepID=A0ABU4TFS6_9PSEU|nr:hypothetical protein [Lentzea sp. BCCO 10_0856]MDX8037035.1 hypothetical protein [Lentzea sp. BCCO 10_0856]